MGARYDALLADLPQIQRPLRATGSADNAYWVYGVVLGDDTAMDAAQTMRLLGQKGIGTRPFFWPMHLQPVLQRMGLTGGRSHPVAERLGARGFYLPSGLALTTSQIDTVGQALREVLDE
jgi:perosamine synthetase